MTQPFQLAACAEMLWLDKPIHWRAARLHEMGFGVGLWNWPTWDLEALERTGAHFTIMNGYLEGRLADAEGADLLLKSAREAIISAPSHCVAQAARTIPAKWGSGISNARCVRPNVRSVVSAAI